MVSLLQVRDLKIVFQTQDGVVKAVNGVSFDLDQGETLGVVGESGCGKSVTALSMLRLVPQPPGKIVSGQVLFDGHDLLQMSEDEIRTVRGKRISMVFQDPMTSLNPVLTVGRQISEAIELHLKLDRGAAQKRAVGLLQKVGIPEASRRMKDYPHQFSGGMRQRVMIAMALSCNPQLLIADEPTTALDVTIQAQILYLIQQLTAEMGTSMILITHNFGVVAGYVDKVAVMYAGYVVETAPTRQLFANPRHPYTAALLRSIPRLDQKQDRLVPIEGQPPDLIDLTSGCPYVPRCPYAQAKCSQMPPLLQVEADHYSACWFHFMVK
ncbi:MAG: ABC transporter ATP-binding protein [Chloroflexi bacterium]|nr:ABC transporter ATP-binding protein [Chloroflexota bacterium]